VDCERDPARVAGCIAKSCGQICGNADADGEPRHCWIAEYFCRFLAGLAAGVLGGYASHLMLDFFTPASLPVV
jgi:hypothetical protein